MSAIQPPEFLNNECEFSMGKNIRIQLKGDQIVRGVTAVCLVAVYGLNVGFNGNGAVDLGVIGSFKPFGLVCLFLLTLAFPELLDRLPYGPSKSSSRSDSSKD